MFIHLVLMAIIMHYAQAQIGFSRYACSQEYRRIPKIVGGVEVEPHELPSMVSLMRRGGHFCGGTIINERWILTAGHCICNGLQQFMKPTHIQAIVGLHSIKNYLSPDGNDNMGLQIDLKNIVPHPHYVCNDVQHDIALLELAQALSFAAHIQPSCVSASDEEYGTVFGWGWTNEDQAIGERADVLRKATVKIWDNAACQTSYKEQGKTNIIGETQMCAGFENGKIDSCWADSGGPLISKENHLLGIVSTGVGCARPGLPGIYTRVSKYVQWLHSVIENTK